MRHLASPQTPVRFLWPPRMPSPSSPLTGTFFLWRAWRMLAGAASAKRMPQSLCGRVGGAGAATSTAPALVPPPPSSGGGPTRSRRGAPSPCPPCHRARAAARCQQQLDIRARRRMRASPKTTSSGGKVEPAAPRPSCDWLTTTLPMMKCGQRQRFASRIDWITGPEARFKRHRDRLLSPAFSSPRTAAGAMRRKSGLSGPIVTSLPTRVTPRASPGIGTFASASSKSTRHAWSAPHARPPFTSGTPIAYTPWLEFLLSNERKAASRPHSGPVAPAASTLRCLTTSTWCRTTTRRLRG